MSTVANPTRFRLRRDRVRLGDRLRVALRPAALDAQLAAGEDPRSSVPLERRAERLCAAASRRRIAAAVERVLEQADAPSSGLSSRAPLRKVQVLAGRRALSSLARELRRDGPVRPQGVAMAQLLLTDICGPLYAASGHDDVEFAARAARNCL